VNRRRITAVLVCLSAALCLPAAAGAKLPKPKSTAIKPGTSIAGVKLDMTQAQAFAKWGRTTCIVPGSLCEWHGPGKPGQQEVASISLVNGKVVQISIKAALVGTVTQKFKLGKLAGWKTSKKIGLASKRGAVAKAYPKAKRNLGEAVNGYDLFAGSGKKLRYTRFAANGVSGPTAGRLTYITLAWDVCHYSSTC
jgi:hypothetical protein